MPYRSEKQRRFMHARHPEIAAEWDKKYGGKVKKTAKKSTKGKRKSTAKKGSKR